MKKILLSLIIIVGLATTSSYAFQDINDYHAIVNGNEYVTVYLPYLNYTGIYLAMMPNDGYASFSGLNYWYNASNYESIYTTIPCYSGGDAIDLYVSGACIIASYSYYI